MYYYVVEIFVLLGRGIWMDGGLVRDVNLIGTCLVAVMMLLAIFIFL
jgi:hypothetical protein